MTDLYAIAAIAVMAIVTLAIRALPFLIFNGKRKTPEPVIYLGKVLPYAIMAMLLVYCLKGISFSSLTGFMPEIIASVLTVGLYVWRRNTLLSIVLGTVAYMLLKQLVFI